MNQTSQTVKGDDCNTYCKSHMQISEMSIFIYKLLAHLRLNHSEQEVTAWITSVQIYAAHYWNMVLLFQISAVFGAIFISTFY
jgi:hypothetical protein